MHCRIYETAATTASLSGSIDKRPGTPRIRMKRSVHAEDCHSRTTILPAGMAPMLPLCFEAPCRILKSLHPETQTEATRVFVVITERNGSSHAKRARTPTMLALAGMAAAFLLGSDALSGIGSDRSCIDFEARTKFTRNVRSNEEVPSKRESASPASRLVRRDSIHVTTKITLNIKRWPSHRSPPCGDNNQFFSTRNVACRL